MGIQLPTPKEAVQPPIFGPCLLWPLAGWIKMPLGSEVGLGPGHVLLDGDPAPHPRKGHNSLHFSAHVYCGQTAGWIRMPLGKEVGLGPGDIELDGNPAPPRKGGKRVQQPHFSAHFALAGLPTSAAAKLLFYFWEYFQLGFSNIRYKR